MYSGPLLSYKKKRMKSEIFPFASMYIDLENIMLGEISSTKDDKYCVISLTRRI